jgi:phosphatidylserine decarboxylase
MAARIENSLPVAREGLPFILLPMTVGAGLSFTRWWWFGVLFWIIGFFSAWFFRDPQRIPPDDESGVLSPADGVIIDITEMEDDQFLKQETFKISIFMSIFNVHVNRVPLSGVIEEVLYLPGKFFSANLDKASQENEHNAVVLRTMNGERIAFVQVAGLIARRIVCWVSTGDLVACGQRFGLIRFGSRLDVYLPRSCKIEVKPKQKVRAGQSILGHLAL